MLKTILHTCLKNFVFFICFFLMATAPLFAQKQLGKPFVTNYSYQDYDAGPINWWALEDNDGLMYFANGGGILQFDGVTWNNIEVNNGVRCLVKDPDGTIYVGLGGDFGYLSPDETGKLEYISLMDKIPEEHKNFVEVWEVDYYKGRVIFRTEFKLYCWDGEKMKVIVSENGLHVGNIVNDTYYLRIWGVGLTRLRDDDTFELVPNGERFTDERIYVILPYDSETLLIGTRTQGFFLYDGKEFTTFETEVNELLNENIYLPGVALKDGRFIVNSFSNGAFLMDHDGKLIQKYTADTGLRDGAVDYSYVDSRGVLWLPLFNGISSIDLNNTFTTLDSSMGLPTNVVNNVYRFNGLFYINGNNGIFYLDEDTNKIIQIEGTHGQGVNFLEHRGRLFTGTGNMGMVELTGKTYKYVLQSQNYDFRSNFLYKSKIDPDRLIVGHQQGIKGFYFNQAKEEYELEFSFSDISTQAGRNSISETAEGNFWVESAEAGEIYLIKPNFDNGKMNFTLSNVKTYNEDNGLPKSTIFFIEADDELHFFAPDTEQTLVYNSEKDKFEESKFFYDHLIGWNRSSSNLIKDSEGKIWFNAGKGIFVAEKSEAGEYTFNTDTFKQLSNRVIWGIYPEDTKPDGSQTVWITGPDGIVRYEGKLEKPETPDFQVKLRNLTMAGDSVLYAGNIDFPEKLKVPFQQNTVSLSYAAPLFIGQKDITYSTQLEGLDKTWSDWTKQTTREYINLPSGTYSFKVKAKNVYGGVSPETVVTFSITTPWYKTLWAYALYLAAFFALIYLIVRTRTRILLKQQKDLELHVNERTKEVQQRLEELDTINNISKALTEKLELNELIQLVGNEMKHLFKSDITYLAILDEEKGIINFPYQDGDDMQPMNYGEGFTSKIIQTGESLLINKDTDIFAQ